MAINLEAIRAKLLEMQKASSEGGNKISEHIWKPPTGKSQVRIVPYAFDKNNPFQELSFHFNIGKRTIISPSTFGRPDPIMEFAEKLKKSGDKDDWKLGRKLEPKMRIYCPVIVRGHEEEGVKFWSFGKQIYTELLSVISDPDYGDITDLMSGRDLTVEHTPAEKEGAYAQYTVRVKPNTSPATTDKDIAEKIVKEQVELISLFTELSYEEMGEVLQKWLDPSSQETVPVEAKPGKAIKGATTATKTDDISSAFDELFETK